jgi:hypothetical protein
MCLLADGWLRISRCHGGIEIVYVVECMPVVKPIVPDLYWIRIQSGQWIRIWIRNADPDQGGQI